MDTERYRYLPLFALEPGMVVAKPLLTIEHGRVSESLPAGFVLTASTIDKLALRHVDVLCVRDDTPLTEDPLTRKARVREALDPLFARANLDQPATQRLFEALLAYRERSG